MTSKQIIRRMQGLCDRIEIYRTCYGISAFPFYGDVTPDSISFDTLKELKVRLSTEIWEKKFESYKSNLKEVEKRFQNGTYIETIYP